MKEKRIYYKRNLSHYQPIGCVFFITIRLAGTIPKSVYEELKQEYNHELSMISGLKNATKRRHNYNDLQERAFLNIESILDNSKFGRKWLVLKPIANLLKKSIHYLDNKKYELFAYTIMPNHLHLIFEPIIEDIQKTISIEDDSYFHVTKITKSLKMFTGRKANRILNRSGQFWQHESYDHVIRHNEELIRITEYVLNNPVKANLCESSEDWPWSYYNPKHYKL